MRLCIDYRAVNACTEPASWPVPHIGQMLVRLGEKKSSIFGIVDLTQGYHQAPVSMSTKVFTAFIAFCGIFHYLRLPFGPKRAPSYFQEMMAAIVLCGLIYFMCEIYLDDCIIHGPDNITFLARLEQVFLRFEKHKIILKPSKCKFGLPKVLNFPLPIYSKQLKSFLGLANYFRPHVKDHSTIARPLHNMLLEYKPSKRSNTALFIADL